jgi:hypothetical protein
MFKKHSFCVFRPGMFPPFCVPDYKLPQENINTFFTTVAKFKVPDWGI